MDSLTDKIAEDEDVDAVELCSILQCLGFTIRSIETGETSHSQEGVGKTVVINCQSSGLHAVLESPSVACSCPVNDQEGGSGFWQICAVSGGRQHDKEFGSSLLGTLPKTFRETTAIKLQDIVRSIRIYKGKDEQCRDAERQNKSASMVELQSTPEKNKTPTKVDTPSRYRSLDALINTKSECDLPLSLPLSKVSSNNNSTEIISKEITNPLHQRQSTFMKSLFRDNSTKSIVTTPGSTRRNNKTSSPINPPKTSILDRLITTERMAVDICNRLSSMIVEISEEPGNDSSMSSLALDVSKIQKAEPPRTQYASSPNLSRLQPNDETNKPNLNRFESTSASNLTITKPTPKGEGFKSKLRKISPNFLYRKEGVQSETKNKLGGATRPKIVIPVRLPKKAVPEPSPTLSAKKKFSHIKSTIPRLNSKK